MTVKARTTQTRQAGLRPHKRTDPAEAGELSALSSPNSQRLNKPLEALSFNGPVDHYFMDSFVLTSDALYGISSDEDHEVVVLKREESVLIKGAVTVPSTGGKDSDTEEILPKKASALVPK
jgi:hypothetical protein